MTETRSINIIHFLLVSKSNPLDGFVCMNFRLDAIAAFGVFILETGPHRPVMRIDHRFGCASDQHCADFSLVHAFQLREMWTVYLRLGCNAHVRQVNRKLVLFAPDELKEKCNGMSSSNP